MCMYVCVCKQMCQGIYAHVCSIGVGAGEQLWAHPEERAPPPLRQYVSLAQGLMIRPIQPARNPKDLVSIT